MPTLSALLGLGIPTYVLTSQRFMLPVSSPLPYLRSNSMGKLIESVVEHWLPGSAVELLTRNAHQLASVLEAAAPSATAELSCQASNTAGGQCRLAELDGQEQLSRVSLADDGAYEGQG